MEKETYSYQNDIIQNKINNLVSIAILLLYNKMLSGRKKSENGSSDEVTR